MSYSVTIDNETFDYRHWSFTDAQSIALCLTSTITGCLSLFGSASIIYTVLTHHRRYRRLYERFVLAVSIADIIASLSIVAGAYMVPSHTGMKWAFGNTATCSVAAFLYSFYTAVGFANMNLSLYFYFTVCKSRTDEYITEHYERIMHATAFFVALAVGVAIVVTQSGNPIISGHFCFAEIYPPACEFSILADEVECERGGLSTLLIWCALLGIFGIPTTVSVVATFRVSQAVIQSTKCAQRAGSDAAIRRQRRVRQQTILYLCSYLNTLVWPLIGGVVSWDVKNWEVHEPLVYSVVFLTHLFAPLQGFFNYFIYHGRNLDLCGSCCTAHVFQSTTRELRTSNRSVRTCSTDLGYLESSGITRKGSKRLVTTDENIKPKGESVNKVEGLNETPARDLVVEISTIKINSPTTLDSNESKPVEETLVEPKEETKNDVKR